MTNDDHGKEVQDQASRMIQQAADNSGIHLTDEEQKLIDLLIIRDEETYRAALAAASDQGEPSDTKPLAELSADFLSWLMTNKTCARHLPPRGIDIRFYRIADRLDFRGRDVKVPARFMRCRFDQGASMRCSKTRSLTFILCQFNMDRNKGKGFDAYNAGIEGDVVIDGCDINSQIIFTNARITGKLSVRNCIVENPGGRAFVANNIRLGSYLRVDGGRNSKLLTAPCLSDEGTRRSRFHGEFCLRNAHIRSYVRLSCASFDNHDYYLIPHDGPSSQGNEAITANQLRADGNLYLDDVEANGALIFRGARIDGNVYARRIELSSFRKEVDSAEAASAPRWADNDALQADNIEIGHSFIMGSSPDHPGSKVLGRLSLIHAKVGGDFRLSDIFISSSHPRGAISAGRIEVKGAMSISACCEGRVDINRAEIGSTLTLTGSRFSNRDVGETISGDKDRKQSQSQRIGKRTVSLLANYIKVGNDFEIGASSKSGVEGFESVGEFRIYGAEVSGRLRVRGAKFTPPPITPHDIDNGFIRPAFAADGLSTAAGVDFDNGVVCKGQVRMRHARIGGSLYLKAADISVSTEESGLCDPDEKHIVHARTAAILAAGLTTAGRVEFGKKLIVTGGCSFIGSRIGEGLMFDGAELTNPTRASFNGHAMTVGAQLTIDKGFVSSGTFILQNANVGGRLTIQDAVMSCPRDNEPQVADAGTVTEATTPRGDTEITLQEFADDALFAPHLKTNGGIWLGGKLRVLGNLNFRAAHINGRLLCRDIASQTADESGVLDFSEAVISSQCALDLNLEPETLNLGYHFPRAQFDDTLTIGTSRPMLSSPRIDEIDVDLSQAKAEVLDIQEHAWNALILDCLKITFVGFHFTGLGDGTPDFDDRWMQSRYKVIAPNGNYKTLDNRFSEKIYAIWRDLCRAKIGESKSTESLRILYRFEDLNAKRSESFHLWQIKWAVRRKNPFSLLLNGITYLFVVLFYRLFRAIAGYGHDPIRAFTIGIAFVVFGSTVFGFSASIDSYEERFRNLPSLTFSFFEKPHSHYPANIPSYLWMGDYKDYRNPATHNQPADSAPSVGTVPSDAAVTSQYNRPLPQSYLKFNPILYSLDAFVPFLDIEQENNWRIRGNEDMEFLKVFYVFHVVMGWLVSTFLAASLARTIQGRLEWH